MKFSASASICAIALSSLVACGGGGGDTSGAGSSNGTGGGTGGGGSSAVETTTEFPLSGPVLVYFRMSFSDSSPSISISGSQQGVSFSNTGWFQKTGSVDVFPLTLKATDKGEEIFRETTSAGDEIIDRRRMYLDRDTGLFGGADDYFGYEIPRTANPLPVTARVGDSGTWYTSDSYTQKRETYLGSYKVTYALSAESSTTALVTFVKTRTDVQQGPTETRVLRITLDSRAARFVSLAGTSSNRSFVYTVNDGVQRAK
jgi:hypothetical protein